MTLVEPVNGESGPGESARREPTREGPVPGGGMAEGRFEGGSPRAGPTARTAGASQPLSPTGRPTGSR